MTTIAVASLVLAACGGDDDTGTSATEPSAAATSADAASADAAGVTIENVWARTSAAGQTTGAVYFDVTSSADDTMLSASVPADIAATAEIHEVVPADEMSETSSDEGMDEMSSDDGMDEMSSDHEMSGDMGGAMVMQELTDGLSLPADETVSLEPGGYHVMLLDLVDALEVGEQFELTLDFEHADSQTISVTVAESAP